MERKVGEIFEYNGEWYQCVEGLGCYRCAFYDNNICIADNQHCTCRSDKKNVIFKKLEKVGEPCKSIGLSIANGITVQLYITHSKPLLSANIQGCILNDNLIAIELKQNKEDMNKKKLNLKPFDLEAAKQGKPVCTRDGRKARIISFDRHDEDCSIIALVVDSKNAECEEVIDYTLDGICNENIINHNNYDLMMLNKKKEGWLNIYKDFEDTFFCIYPTEKEALKDGETEKDYITTIKIEWEE